MSEYQTVETVDLNNMSSDEDDFSDDDSLSPPSQNKINDAIEILSKLTLFTADSELDPLLLKLSNQISKRRLERIKQSPITDFFVKK